MPSEIVPTEPVHFSRLKKLRLSAAHYLADEKKPTPSTGKGSAVHSVMLGGKRCVVYKDGARNDKHAKFQEFKAANEGAHILSPAEAVDVVGMRRSLETHGRAMALLEGELRAMRLYGE